MTGSGEGVSSFITRLEYELSHKHLSDQVMENKTELEKHQIALYGNGRDGIVMQINKMMWRSTVIDKGVSILIAVITSLITFYLTTRLS